MPSTTPASGAPESAAPVAFYAVADRRHFVGAVALLNSLRLVGHEEPLFLVDAGLTADQRDRLAPHVTLLPAPAGMPPVYMAPLGPTARPADVEIVIDADIIAVRRLDELIDSARGGRVVGFVNDPPNDLRYFAQWGELLGAGEAPPRRPYLNAGLFVFPRAVADRLLPRWLELQEAIDYGRTRYGNAELDDPFYFADQDVVNALFSVSLADDAIDVREHRLAPHVPLTGVRILDRDQLVCEHADGLRPFVLHHTLTKPWLAPTVPNAYSRLLPRLLLAPDVRVRLRPEELPLRLREGRAAAAASRVTGAAVATRRRARRQLGRFGIRTRFAALRARRAGRER